MLEDIKARIAVLLEEATYQPQDGHELLEVLREQINEAKDLNGEAPSDLLELQRTLTERLNLPPAK